MTKLSMIVAIDAANGIGYKNGLPWHIPSDLKYFKKVTEGHPIIMGMSTYISLPAPLVNRQHIVLSKIKYPDIETVGSLYEAYEAAMNSEADEAFIIGGKQIYESFADYIDKIYLTVIDKTYVVDTVLDLSKFSLESFEFNNKWKLITKTTHELPNEPVYTRYVLERTQLKLQL